MKTFYFGALLLLASLAGHAQSVRYCTQGHLPIERQPALGYEQAAYLGMGDSVHVLATAATPIPASISAPMRQQFVYVSYPAYRDQPAGQGYVLRRGLVRTADSLLLDIPAQAGRTISTTTVVTTRRSVVVPPAGTAPKPSTKAARPAAKPAPH